MTANVALTDTFDQWRVKTNEVLVMTQSDGMNNIVKTTDTTNSTSNTTGSIITAGGVGIAKSVVIGENLKVHGNTVIDGDTTISGNLVFGSADTDQVSFSADINSSMIPNANLTFNLGNTSLYWANTWTGHLTSEQKSDSGKPAVTVSSLDVDQIAIDVNASQTTGNVLDITADAATTGSIITMSADALTTGSALSIDSDSSSTGTRNIASIVQNHASATGTTTLHVQQDSTGTAMKVVSDGTTTGTAIDVSADALTTGTAFSIDSDSSSTGTRNIASITQNHASATGSTVLALQADAGRGLFIDTNLAAGGYALEIDSEQETTNVAKIASAATSGTIIDVAAAGALTGSVMTITADAATTGTLIETSADALTTGTIANFASDSSTTGTRTLVKVTNDNTAATGTTPLVVKQDSTNIAAKFDAQTTVVIPVGTTAQRGTAVQGGIRYNSTISSFEGYSGSTWGSLGGLIDVDQDTKIIAETSAGADNDDLDFYTAGTQRMKIDETGKVGIGITAVTQFHVSGTDAMVIPVGTTAQRGTATAGGIRYNSSTSQFEGYSGSTWGSLGGLIDVDQDTYIKAETSAGTDNDTLDFFTAGTQRMKISSVGHIGIATTNPSIIANEDWGDVELQVKGTYEDAYFVGLEDATGHILTEETTGDSLLFDQAFAPTYFTLEAEDGQVLEEDGTTNTASSTGNQMLQEDSIGFGKAVVAIVGADEASLVLSDESAAADDKAFVVQSKGGEFRIDDYRDNGTLSANRFLIDASGRVGIGSNNDTFLSDNIFAVKKAGNFGVELNQSGTGAHVVSLRMYNYRNDTSSTLGTMSWYWKTTEVAKIFATSGTDSTNYDDAALAFCTAASGTPTERLSITSAGVVNVTGTFTVNGSSIELSDWGVTSTHFLPDANNSQNIGSTSYKVANLYTTNLYLGDAIFDNTDHADGNIVDGTQGKWRVQEGADDLFVINELTGKKYKMGLVEA